jgi:glycine oxidase
VNVIVVGAGVVGCAIAHELAVRGAHVQIIESRGAGMGATRASAGILAPTIEGHVPALLDLGVRSLASYDRFIERASADGGQPIEYERSGTLQVALDAKEAEQLCTLSRTFSDASVRHTLMDALAARRFEPALPEQAVSALFVPQHGYVAVGPMTQALAAAAANQGAVAIAGRVLSVEAGTRPCVRVDHDTLDADAVIIATGSWTDEIVSGAAPREGEPDDRRAGLYAPPIVKPIRGQLVQVRAEKRPAERVIWGKQCYAVPWRDGRVLVGATVEDVGFDERATVAGVHQLLGEAQRLLPVLRDAAFDEVRVGLRPMTKDELPAVGPSSTMRSVFYATGHYRNGVLLAPLTARLTADLVLDGRESPELALMRPARLGL